MRSKVDWPKLVSFVLDDLFFSQKELATHCNVTQQSVSNWKTSVRQPGPFAKRKLADIVSNSGVRLCSFYIAGAVTGEDDVRRQRSVWSLECRPFVRGRELLERRLRLCGQG